MKIYKYEEKRKNFGRKELSVLAVLFFIASKKRIKWAFYRIQQIFQMG